MAALVLASGQLLNEDCWAPQIAAFGEAFAIHHPDHGSDETVAGIAARLLAQSPPRFHLLAHAMGGFTAFEVMRQAPERVQSLVLIATLASADGPAQTERRQGYIRLVEAGRFAEVVEERVPLLLHPDRRDDPAMLAAVRTMAAETGQDRFLRQQRAIMSRPDSRPSLGAIRVPTLLIRGEGDGITTPDHQAEMLAAIPGARLESLADCGHLPTLDRPDVLNTLLAGWLAAQSSGDAR